MGRLVSLYYRWTSYSEWKFLTRRIKGYFVRGYRGWADHDTWNLDSYLAEVLAGSLRHLAHRHFGCTHEFWDAEAKGDETHRWREWLLDKADWFEWYYRDKDGISDDTDWANLPREEVRRRIQVHNAKMDRFHNEVLADFGKHWGNLWN